MAAPWGLLSPSELLVQIFSTNELRDLNAFELDATQRAVVDATIYHFIRNNTNISKDALKAEITGALQAFQDKSLEDEATEAVQLLIKYINDGQPEREKERRKNDVLQKLRDISI